MRTFLEAFIPLFVAIDPPGMVPVFLGVTASLDASQRRRVTSRSIGTAVVICVAFMLLGRVTFEFLRISPNDFKIAGGVILLVLAVLDIVIYGKPAVNESHLSGVVPLATPLIAGPGTLTTLLVLTSTVGYAVTTVALLLNLALLMAAMLAATRLSRFIGDDAMRAISKLVMILLAAIAVSFIRSGVTALLAEGR